MSSTSSANSTATSPAEIDASTALPPSDTPKSVDEVISVSEDVGQGPETVTAAHPSTEAGDDEDTASDHQFLAILSVILKQLPPSNEMQDTLRTGMIKHWLAPPMQHMRLMLGDESLTLLDCRRCVFYPTAEDMHLRYPRMIVSPPTGPEMSEQHPQRKVQAPALTLMYFIHRHSWPLVKPFILGGGLQSFAELIADSNLYVRAQAVEIFHRITNGYGDQFDWWQKPSADELPIHQQMFELEKSPFLKHILLNLQGPGSFPNGSYLCLQLLAFWLSYVRHFWTQNSVLQLSQETLDALKVHATKENLSKEETELAIKLYEDFSRWPALEDMDSNDLRSSPASPPKAARPPQGDSKAAAGSSQGPIQLPTSDLLKEQGNALFKAGNWAAAAALYTAAIDLARSQVEADANTNARLAVYHSNRSASFAKLWEQDTQSFEERLQYAQKCLEDCDAAIAADPTYLKAHYRKGCMLLDVGLAAQGDERTQYLLQASNAVTYAIELASEDDAVNELVDRIQEALRFVPEETHL